MGKARTPVGAAQGGRKIVPVTHRHGGQHPAGIFVHLTAQAGTEPLLQAAGARPEAAAFAQPGKSLRLPCPQYNAVGKEGYTVGRLRRFQCKAPLHPLPGFTNRQGIAFHPELCRPAVDPFHPQHRIHDTRIIGCRHRFHFCRQCYRLTGVFFQRLFQTGIGMSRGSQPGRRTQQQAEQCFAGAVRDAQQQADGYKKCRKRHKKFRLRQKSAY